ELPDRPRCGARHRAALRPRQPRGRPVVPLLGSTDPGGGLREAGMSTLARAVRGGGRVSLDVTRGVAASWTGLVSLILVGLVLLAVLFAPLLAPYDPLTQDIAARLQGPSAHHLLGTDALGRDLLSRAIYGARIEMSVAIPAGL